MNRCLRSNDVLVPYFLVFISRCCCRTLLACRAARSGGALYAAEASSINISDDSTVSNNTSKWGGGVCLRDSSRFTCKSSRLMHNTGASGGGLNMQETASAALQQGCALLMNTATSEGGGIHATTSTKVCIQPQSIPPQNWVHGTPLKGSTAPLWVTQVCLSGTPCQASTPVSDVKVARCTALIATAVASLASKTCNWLIDCRGKINTTLQFTTFAYLMPSLCQAEPTASHGTADHQ